jgi:predicted transcriptional regulator
MSDPPKALRHLLANKTRRAILRVMLEDDAPPLTPSELSKLVGVDLPTVHYHVYVLEHDGAVQIDHAENDKGSHQRFFVPGALVQAHPEYVAAVLARNDHPA